MLLKVFLKSGLGRRFPDLARVMTMLALLLTVSAGALAQKHHSFQRVFTPNQRTLQNQGANRVETKDEHGIITEPGEGTVKFYTVTGCGTDYGTTISLSGTTTIVESDDGSVYIQDIIATYKTGAWVKGTKSGNTITVPAKQRLYYSSNYDATVSLRWSKLSGTNVIPADETAENFTFTVDETAKTISLNGTSSSVMMSAFWDDDDAWGGYSVWETVYFCGVVDIFLEPKDITDGDITKALNDSIASLGENYIVNNLTINLAAGEAYTMSGTLTAGGNFTLTGNKENPATITMADDMTDNFITLDGTIDFAQKPDNTYSDRKFIGSVDINGVKIFGLRGALINDAQKTLLEELNISNSVIQMPASNKNVIDFNGYVGKVIVENSTIWAADKNAGFFAQYGSRPKNISSEWLQEFKFMNSTFVNIANSKNFNDLKQNGTAQNVYTVKNCIFVDCGKEGKVVIGINKSQQSDTPYWDVDGNVFNFNGADTSGQEVTAAGQQNNEDIVKNSLAGVVAFKDAANGDFNVVFRPAEGVTVPATLPGDPRWTFGTAANEPNTYTVSVKTGTVDADKWKAKAGDGTLQALPLEGVADGEKVTLQYEGRKRVMSVRATKKAAAWDGDLSKLTGSEPEGYATATDGMTITGTLADGVNVKVTIADRATVTLKDATISGVNDNKYKWAGLTCEGNATIVLVGTNSVKGFHEDYPGIYVPEKKTLTIQGDGSLTASPFDGGTVDSYGGGIGGGGGIPCGNITIEGGSITATGGFCAAGIGGGPDKASCGDIRITGGTVEATGGQNAAGIGSGLDATCHDITITSGVTKVTATKGSIGAPCSIGKGFGPKAKCGTVTIGCTLGTDGNPVAGTGTVYWDGSKYVNGGETYLSQSPLTYPEPPHLGDLYYSDGTWSSTLVAGKTPIGVIAYLGTDEFTETDTKVGGSKFTGHGLVLCLKNAASGVCWNTGMGDYEFGESARVNSLDALKRTTDVSGYTNTATLAAKAGAATKYPAAYQAKNYTGLTAPAGTTGWFLPSAQQWVRMMTGLGGLTEDDITWESWFNNDHTAADKWETAMAKAGEKGTAYDSVTDDHLWYWSSSEYSAYLAVILRIEAMGTGSIYGFLWLNDDKNGSRTDYRVRPVLAF